MFKKKGVYWSALEKYLEERRKALSASLFPLSSRQLYRQPKDFPEIKSELLSMADLREIVRDFEKNSFLFDKEFIKEMKDKGIYEFFLKIKLANAVLAEKQELTEKIETLAWNLGKLRAIVLTKDYREIKSIIKRFTADEHLKIDQLLNEIKLFREKIEETRLHFRILHQEIIENTNELSYLLNIEAYNYEDYLHRLEKIASQQEELIYNISRLFLLITKKLLKDKLCRAYI